ncbi:MAG: hypothetical protein ABL907_14240 [Hyphomicrobium sp.]
MAERTIYGASGRRQTIFALAVLALLPFAAALPVLLFQRAADGVWFDFANLLLAGAGLFAILAMLVIELIYSVRARLFIAKTAVRLTLPAGGGPTPMLRYASHDIPYHTIKSVELRREVFGGKLIPVLLRELVIRTKDNREIRVGASLENFADPAFPYPVIAAEIARRAAVPLIDQRTIWRRSRKERALGFISEFDTEAYILDPAEVDRLNIAHRRLVLGLASGLVTLVMLGILADLSAIS